jgi:hypothetical protein
VNRSIVFRNVHQDARADHLVEFAVAKGQLTRVSHQSGQPAIRGICLKTLDHFYGSIHTKPINLGGIP